MFVQRPLYLKKLTDRMHNGMVKVITGIRRCGKSFLLSDIFCPYLKSIGVDDKHIIMIALDDDRNAMYWNPAALSEYVRNLIADDGAMHYVILDEIQKVEEIENPWLPKGAGKIGFTDVLLGLMKIKNVDLYVTGSNSKFLSSDVLTEFRGRGDEVRVFPLNFAEYFSAAGKNFRQAWREYSVYGGLPAAVNMKNDAQKAEYLKNLFGSVYLRDVIERNGIKNESELGDVTDILASSVGSPLNPARIANTFLSEKKTLCSNKTVSKYIDCLEAAFLIDKAQRYDVKGRRYIGSGMKYYFTDVGLRNARLNFRQLEASQLMENVIYNELLVRGYNVDVGMVEYRQMNNEKRQQWRQAEIDFVANQGSSRIYIQSAYQMYTAEKCEQERNSLRRVGDAFKKIIIVGDVDVPWTDEEGFRIIGLEDFLLDEDSINF